jgi:hypothetical protein
MGKYGTTLTIGQFAEFGSAVLKALPRNIDPDVALNWAKNGAGLERVLRDALCPPEEMLASSQSISVDRAQPFDLAFVGKDWKIAEQDERSLALTQVDLSKVQLISTLKKGESWIEGEENLKRLKVANHVRLDAKIFQTLWENQSLIPETWKKKTNGDSTYIFFDGTVLLGPNGYRNVLYLYWSGGQWHWSCYWLGLARGAGDPSAVLANI